MAKLSKDELVAKINEKVMDEDVKIELMEDVTDSIDSENTENEDNQRIVELEETVKTLREKYKQRFLQGSQKEDDEDDGGLEQKEVIDIKEI